MDRPIVSILIPVYNVSKYLNRCIDSVLNQNVHNIEIVAVNDASTDDSLSILRTYSQKDSRFRIIDKPQNEGLMKARESAYRVARGEFFFMLDSDDFIPKNTLSTLLEKQKETGADIVVGNFQLQNQSGEGALIARANRIIENADDYLHAIMNGMTHSLCGTLFSRNIFDNHQYRTLMHQQFQEDRLLLTQILLNSNPKIATVNEVTYYYFINMSSVSRSRFDETQFKKLLQSFLDCWNYVNVTGERLRKENDRYLLKNLVFYIEEGYSPDIIKSYDANFSRLLTLTSIKKILGLSYALRYLSLQIPGCVSIIYILKHWWWKVRGKA